MTSKLLWYLQCYFARALRLTMAIFVTELIAATSNLGSYNQCIHSIHDCLFAEITGVCYQYLGRFTFHKIMYTTTMTKVQGSPRIGT